MLKNNIENEMNFYFIGNGGILENLTWGDLNLWNGFYFDYFHENERMLNKILRKVSIILGKRISVFFTLYHRTTALKTMDFNKRNYILVSEMSVGIFPDSYLAWLNSLGVNLVYVMVNPFCVLSEEAKELVTKSKLVFTYDPVVALEQNFYPFYSICSDKKWQEIIEKCRRSLVDSVNSQLCYIGTINKRLDIIQEVACLANESLSSIDINIIVQKDEKNVERKYDTIINYSETYMQYEDLLCHDISSQCILEIVNDNQHGITRRVMEAILLKKKLLTNNIYLKETPLYDERYMQIFRNPKDIDFEWVKNCNENIEYCYDGCCSPKYIIDRIKEIEGTKVLG